MDTAPLKSFAIWARTALIREVTARISVVLGSQELRQERPSAVAALEKAVKANGGGDKGRDAVADKVAYTWFNRIIALRFMDANGYTGIGVVSPEPGREGGQPEVLAEAKRGNIDSTVVTKRTAESVTNLLNGTRRSGDPQGEAYALLLTEYCRHWNRSMPFMFEQEGDYTELLIPANLLADDSVLARAEAVLTEDVCQDVEVIGWLYQFYISERKEEVFAGFKKNKKAGAAEIPAATQLFTPHWIVRYLVENSLGRLWMLNRPTSRLVDQMDYYIVPVDEEADYLKVPSPEDLKIVDPACGSGHMLTYAFDLLYAIYEEEGYAPLDIPGLILANNLFGIEIDPRAGALAAFALTMKARALQRTYFNRQVEPNVCVLEPILFTQSELDSLATPRGDRALEEAFWNQFQHADTFGSLICPQKGLIEPLRRHLETLDVHDGDLIGNEVQERALRVVMQAEYLSSKYHVVVANPPYMGSGSMDTQLKEFTKEIYPRSKADLFAAFIERDLDLAVTGGWVAMITMQSWMFLSAFSKLREWILAEHWLFSMAHLGTNAFDSIAGEVVSTTAFAIRVGAKGERTAGTYVRLIQGGNESAKSSELRRVAAGDDSGIVYRVSSADFSNIPGSPLAYALPSSALRAYSLGHRLSDAAYGQPGLQTSDNNQFIRYWFEVDFHRVGIGFAESIEAAKSGLRWFPYLKGGDFRKWYGNELHVVDWQANGRRIKEYVSNKYPYLNGNIDYVVKDRGYYFKPMVTYTKISPGRFAARCSKNGYLFDVAGSSVFPSEKDKEMVLGFLCSRLGEMFLRSQNPTLNVQSGDIDKLPYSSSLLEPFRDRIRDRVSELVAAAKKDWDSSELSWEFEGHRTVRLTSTTDDTECRLVEVVRANQGLLKV